MTWARIQSGVVREIRDDIGDDPAVFFHPATYDLFVEVSDKPEVEVGWTYDPESGEFNEPEPVPPGPDPGGVTQDMIDFVQGQMDAMGLSEDDV